MDKPRKPPPDCPADTQAAQAARAERAAAALRENLRRRKAQARARGGNPASAGDALRRDPSDR